MLREDEKLFSMTKIKMTILNPSVSLVLSILNLNASQMAKTKKKDK